LTNTIFEKLKTIDQLYLAVIHSLICLQPNADVRMCLIVLGINVHDEYPLILVANRDEFFKRPTLPLHMWKDQNIVAGKDLTGNGTWLGINRHGKVAAITNYRDPKNLKENAPSRGLLTYNFLDGDDSIDAYIEQISQAAGQYNGYNIILGKNSRMVHYSNIDNNVTKIGDGIFGLSNALFDTSWPKVEIVKQRLRNAISEDRLDDEFLISMLLDKSEASLNELPDTGVSKGVEKKLSAMFIRMPGYGTRCTSVIKKDKKGNMSFTEHVYNEKGQVTDKNSLVIKIPQK